MRCFRILLAASFLSVLCNGCGWLGNRNGGERDPLLMSHLTHSKGDPMFAGTDSSVTVDDTSVAQSASISRKILQDSKKAPLSQASYTDVGEDFTWLKGRLERRKGSRGGWYLRYASPGSKDPYGGAVLLQDDPRLGLFRVGDRVFVEGNLEKDQIAGATYKIDTVRILHE